MALDRQPTLNGTSLRLRPLASADHDALYRAASDPLIWEQHPANRHEQAEFDAFFAEAMASGGALVVETLDGQVIGTSRYHDYDEQASSVEIGWTFLARAYWGGPTNGEIKRLMLDHAFRDVERVYFYVAPDNHRSQRAVEKLGAQRLAASRRAGNLTFELTRQDWVVIR